MLKWEDRIGLDGNLIQDEIISKWEQGYYIFNKKYNCLSKVKWNYKIVYEITVSNFENAEKYINEENRA